MWDQQGGVPGSGDYPLYPNTAYAIELYASYAPPPWGGQRVRIKLEEDAFFDGERVTYLAGRQTAFHLIRSPWERTWPSNSPGLPCSFARPFRKSSRIR